MKCPRCGAESTSGVCLPCLYDAPIEAPQIAGLELELEIGRGGMGSVYRARHTGLGRTVAVKFLPPELADDPEFEARLAREARMLALLNHPNIVGVHDFGRAEERSYIVMEFVDGAPLSSRIPMPVPEALGVARQVCEALAYAHDRGVVHRDIKPENILIDAAGRVKVTDFGIARLARPGTRPLTVAGSIVGTPHYMAPEALDGAEPNPKMDIYSLGVLVYQMITGRLPVGNFEPLPGRLDAVVRRALCADPRRRHASVHELQADLDGAATGEDLAPEEVIWMRAVALLQSISTAVAIFAAKESITPKDMPAGYDPVLTDVAWTRLADGTIRSWARFEMWWTMAALATFAVAITAYGFLRRHWRLAGLERRDPDRPVPESRVVLWTGVASCVIYGIWRLLAAGGFEMAMRYVNLLGGLILVAILFFMWVTILRAWRVSRPLCREPRMWVGFGMSLLPPVTEFATALLIRL